MSPILFGEHDVRERVILENELAFAFPTKTPIVPGHVLICPKRVLQYYEELTKEEKAAVEELREKIKIALQEVFGAEGFNYAWNEEKIGGQSVPHFHLHILPRKEGDTGTRHYEPREFLYRPTASRPESAEEELVEVARSIRNALSD